MERGTPDSTPRIKFDSVEVNKSLGTKRVPSVSTPKRVGGGTTIHQQVLHPQVGKQLHGGNLHRTLGVFAYRQWRFPGKRRGVYTGHPTRTQCHVPAHVIFLAYCFIACLVSVSNMHNMCMWLRGLTAQVTMECCLHQNICLRTQRSMAHSTPSLMIPPSLSTSSLLPCTLIRPSTRPSRSHLQISSSDEIYHCDDPKNVSSGSLADLHSPTSTMGVDTSCSTPCHHEALPHAWNGSAAGDR